MTERARRVYAIEKGTVIDHIESPRALKVLQILGVVHEGILTVGIGFTSAKLGKKDIVKVENLLLTAEQTDRLALIAPTATINIINEGKVVEKRPIHIPKEFKGILRCPNPACVTNVEHVPSHFACEQEKPELIVRCHYCERRYKNPEDLVK